MGNQPIKRHRKKTELCWTELHSIINKDGCTAQKIEKIIKSNPDAIKTKDNQGFLPLHIACCCGWINKLSVQEKSERVRVITILMQHYPDGAKEKTPVSGNTPLLFAFLDDAPDEVIEKILKLCPDAAKICNNEGLSPIEVACFSNPPQHSPSITSTLLANLPDEVDSISVLWRAIVSGTCKNKEVLVVLLNSVSKESLKDEAESYLLKQSIHYSACNEVMLALMDVVSEEYLHAERVYLLFSALDFDERSFLSEDAAVKAVYLLLDRLPKSVLLEMVPFMKETPLHMLFKNWEKLLKRKFIIDTVLSVSSYHDDYGRTPLHILMEQKMMPYDFILLLVRAYPQALLEKGGDIPQTPLEIAKDEMSRDGLLFAIQTVLEPLYVKRKAKRLPADKKLALLHIFFCSRRTSVQLPDDIWRDHIVPYLCEIDLVTQKDKAVCDAATISQLDEIICT